MPRVTIPGVGDVMFSDKLSRDEIMTQAKAMQAEASKPILDPKDLPTSELLKGGWARGMEGLKGTALDLIPALGASVLGADNYAKEQLEEYKSRMADIEAESPTAYHSFRDINTPGDALAYGAENLGEMGPDMIAFMLGAGAGSTGGKLLARRGIESGLRAEAESLAAARGLSKEEAANYSSNLVKRAKDGMAYTRASEKGAEVGLKTGLWGSSLGLNVPDTFNQIYQETGKIDPITSLTIGPLVSALDTWLPERMLAQLGTAGKKALAADLLQKSEIVPTTWKREVGKEVLKTASGEGLTEGAQQVLQNLASHMSDPSHPFFSKDSVDSVLDASLRGFMGGGVMGVPGAMFEAKHIRDERNRQIAQRQEATQQQAIAQQAALQQQYAALQQAGFPQLQQATGDLFGQVVPQGPVQPQLTVAEREAQQQPVQPEVAAGQMGLPLEGGMTGQQARQAEIVKQIGQENQAAIEAAQKTAEERRADAARKAFQAQQEVLDAIKLKDEMVANTEAEKSQKNRLDVLHKILDNPEVVHPGPAFEAELKRQGYRDTTPTELEQHILNKVEDVKTAIAEHNAVEEEPSAPSELTPDITGIKEKTDLTPEALSATGLPAISGIYKQLVGKDPANREHAADITKALKALDKNRLIGEDTKQAIYDLVAKGAEYGRADTVSEADRTGASVPSESAAPESTQELGESPRDALADVGKSVNKPRIGTREQPTTLTPKVNDAVQALTPTIAPVVTQAPVQVPVTEEAPAAKPKKPRAAKAVEAVEEAPRKLTKDEEEDLKATQEWRDLARPGDVPFDVSQGYNAFAEEDIANIDDQLIVRHELLRNKQTTPEAKAAQTYFGKMKRLVDTLFNMGFDLAFNTPIFKAVGGESTAEAQFFKGMNGKQARLASKWVYDSLSPETGKMLREITRGFEIARDTVNDEQFMDLVRDGVEGKKESYDDKTVQGYIDAMKEEAKGAPESKRTIMMMHKILDTVVNRTAQVLHPRVIQALQSGNVVEALRFLAAAESGFISKVASRYSALADDIKVEIRDGLRGDDGAAVPGYFDPVTGTVFLDSTTGMNSHVLLHEVGHYLTSHELENPDSQLARQLQQLFDVVKDSLDSAYGATNVHEFAAEAWSNPEFREKLREIHPNGGKFSAWDKFTRAVTNFIRKILGMAPKPLESAMDEADRIINGLISPAPSSRNGGLLYGPNFKKGEKILDGVDNFIRNAPILTRNQKIALSNAIRRVSRAIKSALLSLLPMHALSEVADTYFPGLGRKFNMLINERGGFEFALNSGVDVVVNQAKHAIKINPAQQEAYDDVVLESTLNEVDPTKGPEAYTKYSLTYSVFNSDGTVSRQEVKYFDSITARDDAVKALNKNVPADRSRARKLRDVEQETADKYRELKRKYDALGTEWQTLYKAMRDSNKAMYEEFKQSILARINDSGIHEDSKILLRRDIMGRLAERAVIDPYFALGREGDFWLAYNIPAEQTVEGRPDRAQEAFKTEYERDERIAELRALGIDSEPYSNLNEVSYRNAPSGSFMNEVLRVLESNGVEKDTVDDMMRLFISVLPETAAAKAFLKRKKTAGFQTDTVSTFVRKSRNMAHQVSNMRYNHKLDRTVSEMHEYANKLSRGLAEQFDEEGNIILGADGRPVLRPAEDNQTAMSYVAEFEKHLKYVKNPTKHDLGSMLASAAFTYTLGFNVSSAIVNTANIPMIVAPYLSGKYSRAEATHAISEATKMFFGAGRSYNAKALGSAEMTELKGMYSIGNYKVGSPEYARLGTLIEYMKKNGQLNRSQAYEILNADPNAGTLSRINAASGWAMHHGERMNREVTAVAAYNLELERLRKKGITGEAAELKAAQKAVYITELTNGGIAAATAPRIAHNALGKLFFMYKRYGVSMYYMMFKTAKDAIFNSDLHPDEKKAAWRQLGGVVGMSALMAGAQGVPLFGLASLVWAMFSDDDDDDLDTTTRKYLGEFMYKGPIEYMTNLSIASRITLNDLIVRDTKGGSSSSTFSDQIMQAVGGPAYGVYQRAARGYSKMNEGHFERGLEDMLPASVSNLVLKAPRYALEGTTTLRGDPITGDVSAWNVAAQALGFAPADYTRQVEINAREKGVDKFVVQKASNLRKRWNTARTLGDTEGMEEAKDELLELGNKHKGLGINAGTIRGDLEKSKKQYDRATKEMVHGVRYSKKMLGEIKQDMAEYE